MGLLKPVSGRLVIDDIDLYASENRELLQSWRAGIAHVPQSIYLSDSTIMENIAYGQKIENIDKGRVFLSARNAQISSFIDSMKHGYQSYVGEGGVRISGGQKQRIGIARALYKQAKILVLDEATSALDFKTEEAVMEALNSFGDDLTVIMVAHRLSTLQNCNRIIRIEGGQVVADGSPKDFL